MYGVLVDYVIIHNVMPSGYRVRRMSDLPAFYSPNVVSPTCNSHLFRTEREGENQQGGAGATGHAVQRRYTMPRGHLLRNKLRVALVWLDEPQRQVALSQFGLAAASDEELQKLSGDLTKRLALKNKLQCRYAVEEGCRSYACVALVL